MNKFDVMIVLGYESDGTRFSEIAKQRVDEAVRIYGENKVKIVFSGGYSLNRRKEGFSEAELMKQYAVERGVGLEDILIEDDSRDTQGNAYFTKQIVMSNNWKSVLVVSSDFHLVKARLFFDYIYGDDYDLSYIGVRSNLSDEEISLNKESDRESIDFVKEIYTEKNIEKGEDKKVGTLLENFYKRFE